MRLSPIEEKLSSFFCDLIHEHFWYLLELELTLRGEIDLVVLKICKLHCHEEAIFALGPLDLGEKSK